MMRSRSCFSSVKSRRLSSASSPVTGTPVHMDTTCATSCVSTVIRSPATCTAAAASSSRSMALSGRKRSFIYRTESS